MSLLNMGKQLLQITKAIFLDELIMIFFLISRLSYKIRPLTYLISSKKFKHGSMTKNHWGKLISNFFRVTCFEIILKATYSTSLDCKKQTLLRLISGMKRFCPLINALANSLFEVNRMPTLGTP